MARIAGIDIPKNKRGVIALTYIFGIGKSRAKEVLANAKVDEGIKVQDWTDAQIAAIREQVGTYTIEGELRSEVQLNIKRLMDIDVKEESVTELVYLLRGQRTKITLELGKAREKQ